MECRRFITIFALVYAVSALPFENDHSKTRANNETQIDYRLPKSTAPVHYDIKMIPDIEGASGFEGESTIEFEAFIPTTDIVLHSLNLTLDENATRLVLENGTAIAPDAHDYDIKTEKLTISFGKTLEPGVYWLNLKFSGFFSDVLHGFHKSFYEDEEGNKVQVVATQFEPTYARRAFPCWDEPALKATFNISIKHHPNYTAISNMPARHRTEVDQVDGKVWTHFEETPCMSTYLVAFVVADYGRISNADGSVNIWGRKKLLPHLKYALEIAEKATIELQRYTNSTVRVPKMDHVALPHHPTGGMENWGLITYPERNLVYNEDIDTMKRKYTITTTMMHELAHQWFGNVVSPAWWSHIWLNEGFSSYFQHYLVDKIFKEWRVMDYFVISVVQRSLNEESLRHTERIDIDTVTPEQIQSIFSAAIYHKAPSILYMLANIVSPEVFRAGLIHYLDKHEYDSADPDCVWRALQTALDKSNVPHADFNVKEVMDMWFKQKRYPLVTVERDYSTGVIKLTQEDFGLIGKHQQVDSQWWVPISYATQSNPDFSNTRPARWLKPQETLVIDGVDPNDWIIVNNQQTGYYRVNYDEVNWRKIGAYLRSENFTKIHVLNRAQIVNDIIRLVEQQRVKLTVFFEVVVYLTQEQDYVPWYPVFYLLDLTSAVFDFPSSMPIKAFVLETMKNLIENVGYEERVDDDPLTVFKRIETLEWACKLGHTECRRVATAKLAEFLNQSKTHKTISHSTQWAFMHGMRLANESIWHDALEWCMEHPSDDVLFALSTTENQAFFEEYLNTSILNDTSLSKKYQGLMIDFAFENILFRDVTVDFFLEHWDEVYSRTKDIVSQMFDLQRYYDESLIKKLRKLCEKIENKRCSSDVYWIRYRKGMDAVKNKVNKWVTALNEL